MASDDDSPNAGSAMARLRRLVAAAPAPIHPEPDEDDRGPVVESYTAEQDLGPYPISILGWPGAYWVDALERDPAGPYTSIEDARHALEAEYGEFIIARPGQSDPVPSGD